MKQPWSTSSFCCAAFAMSAFGCWGYGTETGHQAFDEMSGGIPVIVGEAGLSMLAILILRHVFTL